MRTSRKERVLYLYQGIAERNFERKLAENIHVRGANLGSTGCCGDIELERVIPEANKPRRIIEIN